MKKVMTAANLCVGYGKSSGAFAFALNFLCFFLFFKKKKEEDCYKRKDGDAMLCVTTDK